MPFCVTRCGYCDFNTYTASELAGSGASTGAYLQALHAEIELAGERLAGVRGRSRSLSTVFVGGGTPTLLASSALVGVVEALRGRFGLADDVEVTTEANPDSVTADSLAELAAGGFTRVSFGMQSAVPHVLSTLDRTHDPERIPQAVEWARAAGLQVSLDLIYGTPGESDDDWATSLRSALDCSPDHVSAYALGIEAGTRMGREVRTGQLKPVDPDEQARRYEMADSLLTSAGLEWYEISNWARSPAAQCRHNLGYWRNDDWWGFGPGAHGHLAGRRWWNVKHPARYSTMLADSVLPVEGSETLDDDARHTEYVMLGIRLREGLPLEGVLSGSGMEHARAGSVRVDIDGLVRDGLVREGLVRDGLVRDGLVQIHGDRMALTPRGRLLADTVTRRLLGWE